MKAENKNPLGFKKKFSGKKKPFKKSFRDKKKDFQEKYKTIEINF